jgi:hypothetical protein
MFLLWFLADGNEKLAVLAGDSSIQTKQIAKIRMATLIKRARENDARLDSSYNATPGDFRTHETSPAMKET